MKFLLTCAIIYSLWRFVKWAELKAAKDKSKQAKIIEMEDFEREAYHE